MADEPAPFLIKFWWLPPALLAVAVGIAAWNYRERPFTLDSLPESLLQSAASLESSLGEPPARRVEYRARITTDAQGQSDETTVTHIAEHLGGGWMRRFDYWHEGGAPRATYQERYLLHRNLVQVVQKRRVLAPFVHDLLAEFGWLTDTASGQSVAVTGAYPSDESFSLTVRQSRVAPTEPQNQALKDIAYERTIECRRDSVVEGSTLGSALAGQLPRFTCRTKRSHLPGEAINVYVWEPRARLFLLVQVQQPAPLGGTETQTRRIEALAITP